MRLRALAFASALLGPVALTAVLVPFNASDARDYVFLYLAIVALLGVAAGLLPALVAAFASFLLVDFFFVQPIHTLTIADETDVVNLIVFTAVAMVVGGVGSMRRAAQLRADALANELRRVNRELEVKEREQAEAAKIAVRLAQTERQVQLLEESDRMRRDLLANVSHELRTPLTSILMRTTAVLGRRELPADVRAQLVEVESAERRLGRLVQDMLDVARIEGRSLDLSLGDVDLRDAVDAAVARLQAIQPSRQVEVHGEEGLDVVADAERLGQVLDNLLSNADRYAPPSTPIEVRLEAGRRGMAVVRVIDRGPGVPVDQRERIFERFVHATNGEGAGSGTGLGLAIVKGLVEAHAGRVWLDDDGPGGRFAFSLPLAGEATASAAGRRENVDVDVGEQRNDTPDGPRPP